MSSLRIVIADDHPLVRAALGHSLQDWVAGGALIEAPSFSALTAVLDQQPELDLVLLDLNMPGAKGFSSLIYLRGERPELPDRKSTRLNSSHIQKSRMPSSA